MNSKANEQLQERLSSRVSRAGESLTAPVGFGDRILAQVSTDSRQPTRTSPIIRLRWYSGLTVAATILAVLGLFYFLDDSHSVQASIANIHHTTVEGGNEFVHTSNSGCICTRFGGKCLCATLPDELGNCWYHGVGLAEFRGSETLVILVQSDDHPISVMQMKDKPETLGFSRSFIRNGRKWFACECECCNMFAVAFGEITYVAAGDGDAKSIMALLDRFVSVK